MLESFAAWLGGTPLSAFVADRAWVVPSVQTLHILAIAIVAGGAAILHLRVLGLVEREQSISAVAARFSPWTAGAIVVLAVTGFLMIAAEPTRAIFRYLFWIKMGLLALVIVLTAIQLRALKARGVSDEAQAPVPAPFRLGSALILVVWVGVIISGRWIGYAQGWPGSPS